MSLHNLERKRDFSLRRPTHSQERMRKKKRRPAPFEMTWWAGGGHMPGFDREWRRRNGHSERRAWMTSMRAARAAGSHEATTAAASRTHAERSTGKAPGIFA